MVRIIPLLQLRKRKKEAADEANNVNSIIVLLCSLIVVLGGSMHLYCTIYSEIEKTIKRSISAQNRTPNKYRLDWSEYNGRISERMFYRMYRMKRPCFNMLCDKIERAIGKERFKSEKYINELRMLGYSTPRSRMYHCNLHTSGEYIQGELKVAITLRYLAGASYLDLFMAYHIQANYVHTIIEDVKKNWFCNNSILPMNYYQDVLQNPERLQEIRRDFGQSSGGLLSGCISTIDGWLVKVRCPTLDEVPNPGKYMCRKGFFAMNVQAIVDKKKRILWSYIGEKGCVHDSTMFKNSTLYAHLMDKADQMLENKLYIVGDSAYALRGFLLCPFDNAKQYSDEDNFNFFLSSQRIYVECAFGEIDRRWGIFWKPLEGTLEERRFTIDACFRLHNLIVDFREMWRKEGNEIDDEKDRDELDNASDNFIWRNPTEDLGVIGDDIRPSGRPTDDEVFERQRGLDLRDEFKNKLKRAGLTRPAKDSDRKKDRHNRVV